MQTIILSKFYKKILQKLNIDAIVLNLNKDIRVAGIAARWAKSLLSLLEMGCNCSLINGSIK